MKTITPWVKDLLVAFAGTTMSIILTFGTSALIDHINRNKDRKLTAMMVLSSIESSARSLEASDALFRGDFAIPELSLDSLYTMSRETHLLDSLLN